MASVLTRPAPMPLAVTQQSPMHQSLRLLPRLPIDEEEVRYTSLVAPSDGGYAVPVGPPNNTLTAIKTETPRNARSFAALPSSSMSSVASANPSMTATPVQSATSSATTSPLAGSRQLRSGANLSVLPPKQTGSLSYNPSPKLVSHRPSAVSSTTASAQSLQSLSSWSSYLPPATIRRPGNELNAGFEGPVRAWPVRSVQPAVTHPAQAQGQPVNQNAQTGSASTTKFEGVMSSRSSRSDAGLTEVIGSARISDQGAQMSAVSSHQSVTEVTVLVDEHARQIFRPRSISPLKSADTARMPAQEEASLTPRLQSWMPPEESETCTDRVQVKVRPPSAISSKAISTSNRKLSPRRQAPAGVRQGIEGTNLPASTTCQDSAKACAAKQRTPRRSRSGSADQQTRVVWGGNVAEKSQQSRSKERTLGGPGACEARQHSRCKERPSAAADEAFPSEHAKTRGSVLGLPSSPYKVLNDWMASLCEPNQHRGEGFSPQHGQTQSLILQELETQLASMRNEPQTERPPSTMRRSPQRQRSQSVRMSRSESAGRRFEKGRKPVDREQTLVNELFGCVDVITSAVAGDTGARLRHMQELVDATGSNRLFLRDHARSQNRQEAAESPKQLARKGLPNVQHVTTAGGHSHYLIRAEQPVNEELGRRDGSREQRRSSPQVHGRRTPSLSQRDSTAHRESSGTPQRRRPIARPLGGSCCTPRVQRCSSLGKML